MNPLFINLGRRCCSLIGPVMGQAALGTLFWSYPAVAQTAPAMPNLGNQGGQIAAALAYPNSSQRFFEAGKAQLERSIQQLRQDDETPEILLTIQPEVLIQQSPTEQPR